MCNVCGYAVTLPVLKQEKNDDKRTVAVATKSVAPVKQPTPSVMQQQKPAVAPTAMGKPSNMKPSAAPTLAPKATKTDDKIKSMLKHKAKLEAPVKKTTSSLFDFLEKVTKS